MIIYFCCVAANAANIASFFALTTFQLCSPFNFVHQAATWGKEPSVSAFAPPSCCSAPGTSIPYRRAHRDNAGSKGDVPQIHQSEAISAEPVLLAQDPLVTLHFGAQALLCLVDLDWVSLPSVPVMYQ